MKPTTADQSASPPQIRLRTSVCSHLQNLTIRGRGVTDFSSTLLLTASPLDSPNVLTKFRLVSSQFDPKGTSNQYLATRLRQSFLTMKSLSDPHIVQAVEGQMDESSGPVFEALFQDGGAPLQKLTAQNVVPFIRDSLLALRYLERVGYSCPGLCGSDFLQDPDKECIRLGETVGEKLLPRWAPVNFYDGLNFIGKEYAAPELYFFVSGCNACFLPQKEAITNFTPSLDLGKQDVYAWGMAVYSLLTGSFCPEDQKRNKERYRLFWERIDKLELPAELKATVVPMLKAALSFSPSSRPSFAALSRFLKTEGKSSLGQICTICGCLIDTKECSSCGLIRELIENPSAESIRKEASEKVISKNPYAIVSLVRGVSAVDDPGTKLLKDLVPFLAARFPKLDYTLQLGVLKEIAILCINHESWEPLAETLDKIVATELAILSCDWTAVSYLNSYLASLILPTNLLALPTFFTVAYPEPKTTAEVYVSKLHRSCNSLIVQGKRFADQVWIRPNSVFFLCVQAAWDSVLANSYDKTTDQLVENIYSEAQNLADDYDFLNRFISLCVSERLLQLFFSVKEKSLWPSEVLSLPQLVVKMNYSPDDASEWSCMFQGAMDYYAGKHKSAKTSFDKYFASKPREGNVRNVMLANYCMGTIQRASGKFEAALAHFKTVAGTVPPDRPQLRLVLDSYQKEVETLMDLGRYLEAFDPMQKSLDMHRKFYRDPHAHELARVLLYSHYAYRGKKMETEAGKALEAAKEIVTAPEYSGDSSTARMVQFEVGNMLYRAKEFARAAECYDKNACCNDSSSRLLYYKLRVNQANSERALLHLQESKRMYKDVLEKMQQFRDDQSPCALKLLINLGTVYLELNNDYRASAVLHKAEKILSSKNMKETPMYRLVQKAMSQIVMEEEPVRQFRGPRIAAVNEGARVVVLQPTKILTPEEETISDTLREIQSVQSRGVARDCFRGLASLLKLAADSCKKDPVKIFKSEPVFADTVKKVDQAAFLLSLLGFDEQGETYVANSPDLKLLRSAVDMLNSFANDVSC